MLILKGLKIRLLLLFRFLASNMVASAQKVPAVGLSLSKTKVVVFDGTFVHGRLSALEGLRKFAGASAARFDHNRLYYCGNAFRKKYDPFAGDAGKQNEIEELYFNENILPSKLKYAFG